MKRSEAIKILQSSFLFHMNCECCNSDDVMYSKVLESLEQAGMRPTDIPNDWEDEDASGN